MLQSPIRAHVLAQTFSLSFWQDAPDVVEPPAVWLDEEEEEEKLREAAEAEAVEAVRRRYQQARAQHAAAKDERRRQFGWVLLNGVWQCPVGLNGRPLMRGVEHPNQAA